MQASTGWLEATPGLGIVVTSDQSHELRHGVTVVPRWTESVFLYEPAGRENDKVGNGRAFMIRRSSKDSENGRIGVIKRDRTNSVEATQIILVRVVVAMPGDDIEWGVILSGREKRVVELAVQSVFLFLVIERSYRGLEVSSVGETVGSDRAQFGKLVVALVELTNVSSHRTCGESDTISKTSMLKSSP